MRAFALTDFGAAPEISRVHLQDTYPLDQAPAAFAAFTGGKLVITTA